MPLLAHVGVMDAAEIDPDVRVLMDEERRVVDELLAVERIPLVVAVRAFQASGEIACAGDPSAST